MPAPLMLTTTPQRPLDLKRQLLIRISLFALVVLLLGTVVALLEARYRVRGDIPRIGATVSQLITDEIIRNSHDFNRTLSDINLDLEQVKSIGSLLNFCIEMTDIYSHIVDRQCFASVSQVPEPVAAAMRWVIGSDAIYQRGVGRGFGITNGQLTVMPNYGSEVLELASKLGNLLAVSLMILFLSFFVYRPVRNALAPSAAILETLRRMARGDLEARMPAFALIELNRIGEGFNDLAGRLQNTIHSQQRLAHRLLSAREEERQRLARELHDEFGQCLASLNAEAAFAMELADESLPTLRPCADAIGSTASRMMESLQQILHHLRPIGLEEFGLLSSLQQLIDGWNQRCRGNTVFTLSADERLGDLADDINVSVYRIVQESITNAVRHGKAEHVAVTLQCSPTGLVLEICDDGHCCPPPDKPSESGKAGGYGLLGMEERALALGGSLVINSAPSRGTTVTVQLPLVNASEVGVGTRP